MYRIKNATKLNPFIRGARSVFISIGGQLAKIRSGKEIVVNEKEYRANLSRIAKNSDPQTWDKDTVFMLISAPEKKVKKPKPKRKKKPTPPPPPPVDNKKDSDDVPPKKTEDTGNEPPVPPVKTDDVPPPVDKDDNGDDTKDGPPPVEPDGDTPPEDKGDDAKYIKEDLMEKSHSELDALIEAEGLTLEYSRANPNKTEKVEKFLEAVSVK